MRQLKNLRSKIDGLDEKIVGLLNERARLALKIAGVKNKQGSAVYCPDRETQVLKSVAALSRGPLGAAAVQSIYREIMASSIALEKPLSISYLGPEATFTHQAALKKFGASVTYVPCDSIADVFAEVEKGATDYGVVPIENSIEGAVNHTLDVFVDSDLRICSQIILDIYHYLLAKSAAIKRVYSISQVFGQCRLWLQEHLRAAETIEVSSTTKAAQIAAREKGSAAIASSLAASIYGLKVIADNIEDSPHNRTRFLVIGKTDVPPTGTDKTSLVFSIKDKVGALHHMLSPFRKYKVNLNKIESRPSKRRAWDYYFFVDLEGHKDEPRVKKALAELENKCKFLKILGSYPVGA